MSKSLIRAARVYKAVMPSADALRPVAEKHEFTPIGPSQELSVGFVKVPGTEDFVQPFVGGFAFAIRIDTKVVPGDALKEALEERCKLVEAREGHKPGKKQKKELKEEVRQDLLLKVLPSAKVLTGFYLADKEYLILPTVSSGMSDRFMGYLAHSMGSIKTTTIHVSAVKQGLTTRLKQWLATDETETTRDGLFDVFEPGSQVDMVRNMGEGSGKERAAFRLVALDVIEEGLKQAVGAGFEVDSMQLYHGENRVSFTLTDKFVLKAIDQPAMVPADADLEAVTLWQQQAAVETLNVAAIIDALCKLFDYVPKLEEDAADGELAEGTDTEGDAAQA